MGLIADCLTYLMAVNCFVKDSVLQQGNQTSNWNLIGFGLEGYTHEVNRIELVGNIILMERDGANKLLHIRDDKIVPSGDKQCACWAAH